MTYNLIKKEVLNIKSPTGLELNSYEIVANNEGSFLKLNIINSLDKIIRSFEIYFIVDKKIYSYLIEGSFNKNNNILEDKLISINGNSFIFLGFLNVSTKSNSSNTNITIDELNSDLLNNRNVIKHNNELIAKLKKKELELNRLKEKLLSLSEKNNKNEERNNLIKNDLSRMEEEINGESEIKRLQNKLAEVEATDAFYKDNIVVRQVPSEIKNSKFNIAMIAICIILIVVEIITSIYLFSL